MEKTKLKAVLGVTNRTYDNRFIPFLDYDISDISLIGEDVQNIKDKFELGNSFYIESTNGFNVFFLDKLPFYKCIEILNYSKYVCPNYKKYSKEKHNMTLRLGKDKILKGSCPSPYHNNILSLAHYHFFNTFFKVDIFSTDYMLNSKSVCSFDEGKTLEFVTFMSKKYGYIEVD